MSKTVTLINNFFRNALKKDVDGLKDKIILSDRQLYIFECYYLKKQNINFIADSLFISPEVIHKELKKIRSKIVKAIDLTE